MSWRNRRLRRKNPHRPKHGLKIFSISEAEEAEPVVQKQIQATPTTPTAPTPQTTEQRLEGLKKCLEQKTKASQQPAPQKKNKESADKRNEKNEEPAWVKNYPEALKQWCNKNVDKKTGQTKTKNYRNTFRFG